MRASLRLVGLVLVLGWLTIPAQAQDFEELELGEPAPVDTVSAALAEKSTSEVPAPSVRTFDQKALDDYRQSDDFNYQEEVPEATPEYNPNSVWEKIMRAIGDFFGDVFSGNLTGATVIFYLILLALVVFVVFVIVKGQSPRWTVRRSEEQSTIAYEEVFEDIEGVDFAKLITKAEGTADLRTAVRLHYLWVLQRLSERALIDWKPMKTNRDYVFELGQTPLRTDFEPLLHFFEYVWYGEFPLNEVRYAEWKAKYRAVLDKVPPAPTTTKRSA